MKWLWISGWAVPPDWFAGLARTILSKDEHWAVAPAKAEAAVAAGGFDALGGYSLGSLWLLRHAGLIPPESRVVLLAPIFAFPAEAGLGGLIPLAQLRLQKRHLRRDPVAALAEFAQLSGLATLNLPAPPDALDAAYLGELEEGLNWLETWSVPPPPPSGWRGFVGDNDPLLDPTRLHHLWPGLAVVPRAGHLPGSLLKALANS